MEHMCCSLTSAANSIRPKHYSSHCRAALTAPGYSLSKLRTRSRCRPATRGSRATRRSGMHLGTLWALDRKNEACSPCRPRYKFPACPTTTMRRHRQKVPRHVTLFLVILSPLSGTLCSPLARTPRQNQRRHSKPYAKPTGIRSMLSCVGRAAPRMTPKTWHKLFLPTSWKNTDWEK